MTKLVAIVGRTNVGKSSLFNRLIKKRLAVTSCIPKTTRDRLYADVYWNREDFILIDTAGIDVETGEEIPLTKAGINREISEQIKEGIKEADLLLFVVDAQQGLVEGDKEIADIVRKSGKQAILVANKADNANIERNISDFDSLGFGLKESVSSVSGRKSGELLDLIANELHKIKPQQTSYQSDIDIAILGRPNVGKSTLTNNLVGRKRVLVSDVPGTTIDSIDVFLSYKDKVFRLIDTAGIRRRGKIKTGVEKFSVLRALKSIARADLVILVIDGIEGITKQDMHIAQFVLESGRGLALAVNKWDIVEKERSVEDYLNVLRERIRFLPWSPVVFISALTGKNTEKLLELSLIINENRNRKITSRRINEVISKAVMENPPKSGKKLEAKVYYSSQTGTKPPCFTVKVNNPDLFHFSYVRYLEKKIREQFDFTGTPIIINLKSNKDETR